MSNPAAADQAPLDQAAYARLMAQAYDPIYFDKLAAAGYVPQSAAEADAYRAIGARLYAAEAEKRASYGASFAEYALARLGGAPEPAGPAHFKAAAAAAVADGHPIVADALALAASLRGA